MIGKSLKNSKNNIVKKHVMVYLPNMPLSKNHRLIICLKGMFVKHALKN